MSYRDTSLEAYLSVDLSKGQKTVLDAIKEMDICNDRDISEHLDWPINRITNRRGELLKLGLIEDLGKHIDAVTRRSTYFWRVKREEQGELF